MILKFELEPLAMQKFLLIAGACLICVGTFPARAQVYFDADRGAIGTNRLDDPDYGWPHSHWRRGYDAYARGECRIIRERVVMPDGTEVIRSREICG